MNNDNWRELAVDVVKGFCHPQERETHINFDETMKGYFTIDSRQKLVIEQLQKTEDFDLTTYYTNEDGKIYYIRGTLPLNALRLKSEFSVSDRVNNLSYILN